MSDQCDAPTGLTPKKEHLYLSKRILGWFPEPTLKILRRERTFALAEIGRQILGYPACSVISIPTEPVFSKPFSRDPELRQHFGPRYKEINSSVICFKEPRAVPADICLNIAGHKAEILLFQPNKHSEYSRCLGRYPTGHT